MAPTLPKEYKVAIFESKGAPLTYKTVPLEEPKAGEVSFTTTWHGPIDKQSATADASFADPDQDVGMRSLPLRPRCPTWRFRQQFPNHSWS